VVWKESYSPYGDRQQNQAAALANRQWFGGKPQDSETGLSYFGARYYDPVVGRFMGIDSVGFSEKNLHSFNRYGYGNNNPYRFVDVDGMESESVVIRFINDQQNYRQQCVAVACHGVASDPDRKPASRDEQAMLAAAVDVGGALFVIKSTGQAIAKGVGVAEDFFAGTKETSKVLRQMQQGDFHAFPESVKAFQEAGQVSKIVGNDGIARDMLKIPGEYKGKKGDFEFIKDANGDINHRYFQPIPGQ
jgi:RHS repeat-associated protein